MKGFFHLLSANFVINFIGFSSQMFVAKFLTPIDLGRIKTMQSFITLAVIIAGFGFNTAVLKLCSEERSLEDKQSIFKMNLLFTYKFTVLVLVVIAILALLGVFSPDKIINQWMFVYMFSIPTLVISSILICYLQALKKIHIMAYAQVCVRVIGLIGVIGFTYYWKMPGYIVATILIGYISLFPLFHVAGLHWQMGSWRREESIKRLSFYYGKWSLGCNGLNTFGASLDIFLLNYFIKERAILGDYGLATVFILALNQITGTVQAIATPFFSEKSNNRTEFLRVFWKYQKMLIGVAVGVAVLSFILVPWFIGWFYTDKYKMTGIFFQILVLKYFLWSCYALTGVALIGLGRMKDNLAISIIIIPILLISSVIFFLLWGPRGIAWAQVLGGVISVVLSYKVFNNALSIHNFKN